MKGESMKQKIVFCLVALIVMALSASGVLGAEVSQGKCIKFDKEKKLVAIEEYDLNFSKEFPYGKPTGVESVYDVSKAQVGIPPEPGDVLRIAYDVKGTERIALKVMNVSKQDLRKK
jgi:hypothetical protein